MSKCISSRGEYSEHEGTGEYCDWCGDCNHAAIEAAAEQRGAARALREAAAEANKDGYNETNHSGILDWMPSEYALQTSGWLDYRADRIADQMEGRR